MLSGILGLSTLVGLIPVTAITVIGLPLVPFVILALILLWMLGYLTGVYTMGMALLEGTGVVSEGPGLGKRFLGLALGLVIATLLNFIQVLGGMINLAVGFLGVGAIVRAFVGLTPTHGHRAEAGSS